MECLMANPEKYDDGDLDVEDSDNGGDEDSDDDHQDSL